VKSVERLSQKCPPPILAVLALLGFGFFRRQGALAAEYYVSPTGSDSNPGTQASPWGTVQKAASRRWPETRSGFVAEPTSPSAGHHVFEERDIGTHRKSTTLAYQGEVPKIDFLQHERIEHRLQHGYSRSPGSWLLQRDSRKLPRQETTVRHMGFEM